MLLQHSSCIPELTVQKCGVKRKLTFRNTSNNKRQAVEPVIRQAVEPVIPVIDLTDDTSEEEPEVRK